MRTDITKQRQKYLTASVKQHNKYLTANNINKWLLMIAGVIGSAVAWYILVKFTSIKAFNRLPDPLTVFIEWFSRDPDYGLSVFTKEYYLHVWHSTYRAFTSFFLAVLLGVPLGIMMGWKTKVHNYASALIGLLRPIPPLAWVPVAILIFPGTEPAVIYVTFLVAFFATTMNTLLGVHSIDEDYFRAAQSLGARSSDVLKDIVIPGALPSMFTGLQIAMGAAWFSLVAGEMIAAQYGLGFMILESYNLVQYPTIVIMMGTLGIVGYASSAGIRYIGNKLMRWRQEIIGASS